MANRTVQVKAVLSYRYVGDGGYYDGIPARDLSLQDASELGEERLALAIKLGLHAPTYAEPATQEGSDAQSV